MRKKRNKVAIRSFTRFLAPLIIVLFLCTSLIVVPPVYSEEFRLKMVGPRYEPVPGYYEPFILPGTDMKFGSYLYRSEGVDQERWGFLMNDGRFWFVQDNTGGVGGGASYGIVDGYLIVDCWASGAHHNRSMYLFKYGRDAVKLLDVIQEAYVRSYGMDFTSVYPGEPVYGAHNTNNPPVWTIKDRDARGHPLIRTKIDTEEGFYRTPLTKIDTKDGFYLYFGIVNGRLRVVFDPQLYLPLFREVQLKYKEKKPDSYYVYGFLAKELSMKEVAGASRTVREILLGRAKWDSAFHDMEDRKIELLKYDIDRR